MRAKFAEAEVNSHGLFDSLMMFATIGSDPIISGSAWPPVVPSKTLNDWGTPSGAAVGFNTLGWAPDGQVRCRYWFVFPDASWNTSVQCDLDGDGGFINVNYLKAGVWSKPTDWVPFTDISWCTATGTLHRRAGGSAICY